MDTRGLIDPSKPTQAEIQEHTTRIAKANLACDLAKTILGNPAAATMDLGHLVEFVCDVAERIISTYSLSLTPK